MKRFKNILLICDFDTKQHLAVERAVSLARQNEARLTVITVVKEIPSEMGMAITAVTPQELFELVIKDRQEKTDALVADMGRQGIDARSLVITGTPFLEIIRQVLRDKHDLVILAAEGKVGLMLNIRKNDLDRALEKLPALERPTVSPLAEEGWVAVSTIVDEYIVRDLIPDLTACGATGIVEFPLNKIVL